MGGVPWSSLLVLPLAVAWLGADRGWNAAVPIVGVEIVAPAGTPQALPVERLARRPEGDAAESGIALPPGEALAVLLAEPVTPSRIIVQGAGDDVLFVAAAPAGGSFREIWRAPRLDPPGLRTRRSPRLAGTGPVDRLLVAAARERSTAVSDVRVLAPRFQVSRWTPVALVWLAFLAGHAARRRSGLRERGERLLATLAAGDAIWTVAGLAFAVPGMALPAVATLGIAAAARACAVRGAAPVWGRAATLAALAAGAAQLAFATRGSGLLLGPELLGSAYDALAESLLHGRSTVAEYAIRWESFQVDGRSHMYFGPLPALLRVLPNAVMPSAFGLWSRLSCLLAAATALGAFAVLAERRLQRNASLGPGARRTLLALLVLGFGCGSPLLFLGAASSIYHESILWGLACSLCAVACALAFLETPRASLLCALATAAGCALLARATFGAPLYAVTAVLAAHWLWEARRESTPLRVTPITLALAPAAALLALQLWYNADRFGSAFTFIDFAHLGYLANEPASWATLERSGTFHPARLPDALRSYFAPGLRHVSDAFPFVHYAEAPRAREDLYPSLFGALAFPLTLSTPWLLSAALAGWALLARTPRPRRPAALLCALALLAELILVMSYYIVDARYVADFLPALVFGAAFLLSDARGRLAAALPAAAAVLVAISTLVTVAATLSWIPDSGPQAPHAQKETLNRTFRAVDAHLHCRPPD